MANTQEKKESGFLVYQLHNFHPTYYLKGDRAIGNSTVINSFNLVQKQTNTNTVLLHVQSETGTAYQIGQIVSLKSSRGFQKGRHVPSLKTLTLFFLFNTRNIIVFLI